MIKAVLFDMDGVLIDAKEWHYDALNDSLALFGFSISREAHLTTYDGLPTRKKLELLTKTRGFPRGLHEFVNNSKQQRTVMKATELCRPVFQHRYALAQLKASGVKIGVCSNSIRRTVELMMQLSKLDSLLDLVVSNEDVERPKPDPEMYTLAMTRLGADPSEVLILEDNDHGIAAAKASGAHVFVVASPSDVHYDAIRHAIARVSQ